MRSTYFRVLVACFLALLVVGTDLLAASVDLGLYATKPKSDAAAMKKWAEKIAGKANAKSWDTGKELLERLTAACGNKDSIANLTIVSHGWGFVASGATNRGGVWSGGPNRSGFYSAKLDGDHKDARYLKDLQAAIAAGTIRFCEDCKITLTGCRVAVSTFAAKLASITGCEVIAARGASSPVVKNGKETGWFLSAAGSVAERDGAKYLGWSSFKLDPKTKKVVETHIGTKVGKGSKIQLWKE